MTPDQERAAVGLALSQGWLTPARLREALLLREHLRATGRRADLLPLLAARFLRPEHARELERRSGGPGAAPPPVMAQDLERSVDLLRRPAEQDPTGVRQFLASLPGAPGLAQMARNDTMSLAPGASPAPRAPASDAPRPSILPRLPAMPQRLGPYEVVRELARGGMGAVYVARHTTLDRQVALKVLLGMDAGRLKRFEIEARATARLRHSSIVPIHEVGEDQGVRFLVMDLIEGVSLKDKIDRDGPLPPKDAARITERIARALDYAHKRGVLHRDMKPSNVLLDAEGEPLVTDFGLAKEADGEDQLTKTGQLIGTPVYMPPEQATGAKDRIDARSDVYSVGATLYEMLTGGPPFQGDQLMNVVVAVVREVPTPPSRKRAGIDGVLEAICLRCLEKEPAARYPSAGALADDLQRWLAGQESGAPSRRGGADRRLLVPLAALALSLGACAAWLGLELRSVRRARDAQSHGLALLAGGAGSVDAARASESLEEALRLDPSLRQTRVALARLALDESPPRVDAAEALLAPLAGDRSDAPPEVALLLGRVADARGRAAEALLAYEAAAAGSPAAALRPDVARRLAGARAVDREARGWGAAAEAAWWDALRAAPLDPAPLAAIARLRLRAYDVGGLARLWEEAHRRLGRPGERDLQQRLADEAPAVARALRDPAADARERARAVLFASALLREEVVSALRALAEEPGQTLLREAARAALLAQAAAPGAGEAARRAAFAGWCARLDETLDEDGAALRAITLLEQAAWLEPGDRGEVERLARARAPLVRAALALAVVVSATRDGGLELDRARTLLRSLARDEAALVADTSKVALGALDALTGTDPAEVEEPAVLLARRLTLLPGLAPALLTPGHGPALERALERGASAALWVAQASDLVERADAEGAASAVERALALDPACVGALELRAQLGLLGHGAPPVVDPFVGVSDPEAARAARARLEFTRRHGAAALPAPAGALRAVVSLREGGWPRVTDDALTVHDSPDTRRTGNGLETRRPLHLRTKFAFVAWHSLRYEWSASGDKFLIWLHATHDAGVSHGLLFHVSPWNGDSFIELDHVFLGERRRGDRPGRDHAVATWSRPGGLLFLDGRFIYRVHVPARERASAGTAAVEVPYGRSRVRALVFEGVWDPSAGAPTPPDAARRRTFDAALVPLDPRTAVLTEHRELPPPGDLAAARGETQVLWANGRWLMNDRRAEVLYVPEVTGDLEVRARVTFPGSPDRHAGLMLRSSRSRGDALLFGPFGDPKDFALSLITHRDLLWEKWLRADAWTAERPVHLALQRIGDWVIARAGPEADRLEDFGQALYFPTDGPVDVGVFARNGTEQPPSVAARFEGLDVRVAR